MILEGILEQEPNLSFASNGKAICNFSLDGTRCIAWEELAGQINQYIKVGDRVKVFGSSKERWWTTSGGEKRSAQEFTVNRIQVVERPKPIENCCYYCAHLNVDCIKTCYNALGGPSYMEVCEVKDGRCVDGSVGESNKVCFEVRL